jgi:hypothetical protein
MMEDLVYIGEKEKRFIDMFLPGPGDSIRIGGRYASFVFVTNCIFISM